MKDCLSGRMKKVLRKRQDVGCPSAKCHYDNIAHDALSIVEQNALHAIIAFIQLRKFMAFVQFDAERFGPLDKQRFHNRAEFMR